MIYVNNENREKRIEEKIDEKIEKRVDEKIDEKLQTNKESHKKRKMSRRKFFKTVAGGAAGLGAALMLPSASALDIQSSEDFNYYGAQTDNPDFSIGTDGLVEAKGGIQSDDTIINQGGSYVEKVKQENIGSSTQINLEESNVFVLTLEGDISITIEGTSADPQGNSFTLVLEQDGSGNRSITWPSTIMWSDGSEPELSKDPNMIDVYSFISYDGGSTWIGIESAKGVELP